MPNLSRDLTAEQVEEIKNKIQQRAYNIMRESDQDFDTYTGTYIRTRNGGQLEGLEFAIRLLTGDDNYELWPVTC